MSTILVVDDEVQSRYLLEVLLSGNGYRVVSAADGAQALEAARRDPPDLVVSDILMPVMDGYTLCRHWKADERLKGIPFVFYTAAYTETKERALGLELGAVHVIVKPEQPEVLLHKLKQALDETPGVEASAVAKAEREYLREYSEVLFHKLEQKMAELEKANSSLRSLIEAAPFGIFTIGEGFRIKSWNAAAEEIFGWSEEEVLDQPIPFFDEQALAECQSVLSRILAGEKKIYLEGRHPTKRGEWIRARLCLSPMPGREGGISRVVAIAEDVTHVRQADEALLLLERAIESVSNAVAILAVSDEGSPVIYANAAFAALTGCERGQIIDQPLARLHEHIGESALLLALEDALREGREVRIRAPLHRSDGTTLWGDLAVSYVRDQDTGDAHAVLSLGDISEQVDAKERFRYGAFHDRLTGLANGAWLTEQLERAIAEATGSEFMVGVIVLGVERLQGVTEQYGEAAGNRLLKIVGQRLVSCVRDVDRVAHLGGEEFAIGLPRLRGEREVEALMAQLLQSLSVPVILDATRVKIDPRLGMSLYPGDAQGASELLRQASRAMRATKPH